ncbi:MAG: hypothetical protein IJ708_10245 [Clostridia bacterium]|nr:hypothetical protein [Clostridia bacterium]
MTVRQEAYSWIDKLPDDCVKIVIEVMMKMVPSESRQRTMTKPTEVSAKIQAYQRMQELRKKTAVYEISESERAAALDEKYGNVAWVGGSI